MIHVLFGLAGCLTICTAEYLQRIYLWKVPYNVQAVIFGKPAPPILGKPQKGRKIATRSSRGGRWHAF
jgi:hypothetical protein